ncbi:MAG: sigma-54-dependent Fis family transcriptional regulator [Simplicispira suum]|uniref:sigma-54-dependent Fis family transcriptional regulator n=1 Tax=Simplicispira suum TaxID=2109915 RepID=UPI001C6AF9D0|nr:sigma-54-dependent Fis family transcriptional regulator [Simplicispira suum]MBW7832925.1 sigma-54-dependent Fis family transcriptional regulator [Simplicispira suum]
MPSNSAPLALRQARQHLLEFGQCPSGLVNERLARSWSRSMAAGLAPNARVRAPDPVSSGSLRHALSASHTLLAHSRPIMEYVFDQVRHSQSVVVLADPRGMLMHTLGDAHFADKAARVALSCGASWHEEHRGTNAIGTALVEGCAVQIHGSEHFLERNGFLTCAASPIVSATGEMLGILDISSDHRSGHAHAHTLGLVSTAARMIENRLITAACKRDIRLHLHPQPEGIGSMAEGIVAVSSDGWIIGANRAALAQLGLQIGDIGGAQLEHVLDVRLEQLLTQHQRRPLQTQMLRLHNGAVLFAQVQVDAAAWPSPAGVVGARAGTVPAADDALARLDTGDARSRAAAEKARRVLGKPIAVLIQGECGVGKEVFARAMHASGPRRGAPFVAINCGAIPETLIEAELFGYVAGAFTGARKEGSLGRLREADGGTLFLDEIGDMPLPMQTRLLRVLQERSVTPVGSGTAVSVDFALVCATHCQLLEAAAQGRFRQDLYYRINGLTLQLPALRERSDFAALTQRLLQDLHPERPLQLAPELYGQLAGYAWPGNLRQVASVLRTACAMLNDDEDTLDWTHMPDDLIAALSFPSQNPASAPFPANPVAGQQATLNLQELSHAAIQQALQSTRGNVTQAARQLGISRQTIYRRLEGSAVRQPS